MLNRYRQPRAVPKWRLRTRWDPSVSTITTAVGKRLPAARSALLRVYSAHIVPGNTLEGQKGAERLDELRHAIEHEFARALDGRDGWPLITSLRRLSRRMWVLDAHNPTEHATRLTAELAVHKWATWSGQVDDPDGQHWGSSDAAFDNLAAVIVLAEAVADVLAWRRSVNKGVTAVMLRDGLTLSTSSSSDEVLDRLIRHRDRRAAGHAQPLGVIGLQGLVEDLDGPARIITARWRHVSELIDPRAGNIDLRRKITFGLLYRLPAHDLLADWGWQAGIGELLKLAEPLADTIRKKHGCHLADIIALLDDLSTRLRRRAGPTWWLYERLLRYGYACARWPAESELRQIPHIAVSRGLQGSEHVTADGVRAAARLVVWTATGAELHAPTMTKPIAQLGDWYAYDAPGYGDFVLSVVADASRGSGDSALRPRTEAFEAQVHNRLSAAGAQPFPPARQVLNITDLDASVVTDGVLVAVDCYSSPWSAELDRGDYNVTRNRATDLRDKLERWHAKWTRIAASQSALMSLKSDENSITAVLPVVVTVEPEWVLTEDTFFWLNDDVPRICTVEELVKLLTNSGPSSLGNLIQVRSGR